MHVCYACRDRKRWILSVPVKGELWLDSGAVAAVKQHSKSLFAAGILNIQGAFAAQDAVVLCDASGYEFARGLCNYTHQELLKVQVSRPVLTQIPEYPRRGGGGGAKRMRGVCATTPTRSCSKCRSCMHHAACEISAHQMHKMQVSKLGIKFAARAHIHVMLHDVQFLTWTLLPCPLLPSCPALSCLCPALSCPPALPS